jgi:hypothetical protein
MACQRRYAEVLAMGERGYTPAALAAGEHERVGLGHETMVRACGCGRQEANGAFANEGRVMRNAFRQTV